MKGLGSGREKRVGKKVFQKFEKLVALNTTNIFLSFATNFILNNVLHNSITVSSCIVVIINCLFLKPLQEWTSLAMFFSIASERQPKVEN